MNLKTLLTKTKLFCAVMTLALAVAIPMSCAGSSPETPLQQLFRAAEWGNTQKAAALLAQYPGLAREKDDEGVTALFDMGNYGGTQSMAKFLVQHGAELDVMDTHYHYSLLYVAEKRDFYSYLRSLFMKRYKSQHNDEYKQNIIGKWLGRPPGVLYQGTELRFFPDGTLSVTYWNGEKVSTAGKYRFLNKSNLLTSIPEKSVVWHVSFVSKYDLDLEDGHGSEVHFYREALSD